VQFTYDFSLEQYVITQDEQQRSQAEDRARSRLDHLQNELLELKRHADKSATEPLNGTRSSHQFVPSAIPLPSAHKTPEQVALYSLLLEMGFPNALADSALEFYGADRIRAIDYCRHFVAIRQMGFEEIRIQEALLVNDLNRDKAMSYLLDGK